MHPGSKVLLLLAVFGLAFVSMQLTVSAGPICDFECKTLGFTQAYCGFFSCNFGDITIPDNPYAPTSDCIPWSFLRCCCKFSSYGGGTTTSTSTSTSTGTGPGGNCPDNAPSMGWTFKCNGYANCFDCYDTNNAKQGTRCCSPAESCSGTTQSNWPCGTGTGTSTSPPSGATLSVDKTSGSTTDTYVFTITFSQFPTDSNYPLRLEYSTSGSNSWKTLGSQTTVSALQRNGNSISGGIVPSTLGITQAGSYDFRAVVGTTGSPGTGQVTNTVTIIFSGGADPCNQEGVCWPTTSCDSTQGIINGFCVKSSLYSQHTSWFQPLGTATINGQSYTYSCGPNFCLVANSNDQGCWNVRSYCYSYFDQSPTGCTQAAALPQQCQNQGGSVCSSSVVQGSTVVDPQGSYGPIRCQGVQATTTSTAPPPPPPPPPPPTTTTTTPPITTSTTTTTTTTTQTVPPLAISCNTCIVNSQCQCSIDQSSCGTGFFTVQNAQGNPLPLTVGNPIPPYTVYFYPNQTGSVNATARCFDPFPGTRTNSVTVPVLNPFLICPSSATVNVQTSCQVNNCNSGYIQAVENNVLLGQSPFTSSPFTLAFTPPSVGTVNVTAFCQGPFIPLTTATIPVVTGTTAPPITQPPVIGTFTGSNFQCSPKIGTKITCSFTYTNKYTNAFGQLQDIIVQFNFANNGVVVQNVQGNPVTAGPGTNVAQITFDCSLYNSGVYIVSWKAYADETRTNPIAWSTNSPIPLPQAVC